MARQSKDISRNAFHQNNHLLKTPHPPSAFHHNAHHHTVPDMKNKTKSRHVKTLQSYCTTLTIYFVHAVRAPSPPSSSLWEEEKKIRCNSRPYSVNPQRKEEWKGRESPSENKVIIIPVHKAGRKGIKKNGVGNQVSARNFKINKKTVRNK